MDRSERRLGFVVSLGAVSVPVVDGSVLEAERVADS